MISINSYSTKVYEVYKKREVDIKRALFSNDGKSMLEILEDELNNGCVFKDTEINRKKIDGFISDFRRYSEGK